MHAGAVERSNQNVKNKLRRLKSRLPYKMPRSWTPYAVSVCSDIINRLPASNRPDNCPSDEILHRRKLNVEHHLKFAFGDIVHATRPKDNDWNTVKPRTQTCVFVGTTNHSFLLIHLATNKLIRRSHATAADPTDLIYDKINKLAELEDSKFNGIPLSDEWYTENYTLIPEHTPVDNIEDVILDDDILDTAVTEQHEQEFEQSVTDKADAIAREHTANTQMFDDAMAHAALEAQTASNAAKAELAADVVDFTRLERAKAFIADNSAGYGDIAPSDHTDANIISDDSSTEDDADSESEVDSMPQFRGAVDTNQALVLSELTHEDLPLLHEDVTVEELPQFADFPEDRPHNPLSSPKIARKKVHFSPTKVTPKDVDDISSFRQILANLKSMPHAKARTRKRLEKSVDKVLDRILTRSMAHEEPNPHDHINKSYSTRLRGSNRHIPTRQNYKKWSSVNNMTIKEAEEIYGLDATEQSIMKEIVQFLDFNCFSPIYGDELSREERRNIISSKLFLKSKVDTLTGQQIKLKSRVVMRGDMQRRDTVGDTSSPTAALETVKIMFCVACFERRKCLISDLTAAYLANAYPEDEPAIFIRLSANLAKYLIRLKPEYAKYLCKDNTWVGRVTKTIYGLMISAIVLWKTICTFLESVGFTMHPKDRCLWNKTEKDGSQSSILIYVDDIALFASDKACKVFMSAFEARFPKLTIQYGEIPPPEQFPNEVTVDRGLNYQHLGVSINYRQGEVRLSMQSHLTKAISDFSRAHLIMAGKSQVEKNPFETSINPLVPVNDKLFVISPNSKELPRAAQQAFHSIVMQLFYTSKRVRPDVLLPIAFLATRCLHPTFEDWHKLRKIVSFLNETISQWLILKPQGLYLESYIDASYGCHAKSRGQSGCCITLGGAMIYCASSKQGLVANSTMEAEMIAGADSCHMLQYFHQFMILLGYRNIAPVHFWEDNKAAIDSWVAGISKHKNTKHIDVRFFYVHDLIYRDIIRVALIDTTLQIGDLFTKGVSAETFHALAHKVMNSHSELAVSETHSKPESATYTTPPIYTDLDRMHDTIMNIEWATW